MTNYPRYIANWRSPQFQNHDQDDSLYIDDHWDHRRIASPVRFNELRDSSVTRLAEELEHRGASLKNATVYVIDFPGSQKRVLKLSYLQQKMREERFA